MTDDLVIVTHTMTTFYFCLQMSNVNVNEI
jgi:hypothetical protein